MDTKLKSALIELDGKEYWVELAKDGFPENVEILENGKFRDATSEEVNIADLLWKGQVISYEKPEEEELENKKMANELVENLNRNVLKSVERNKRWEKIYAVERSKWPSGMGSKSRNDIPVNLHPLLDECITKSRKIALEACQTEELTNAYLKANAKETGPFLKNENKL